MWGIIPAAGKGTRIQPLAFSKELLPVGARERRPRAVSDYLVERFAIGGVTRLCFVIAPNKSDILSYYGGSAYSIPICYCVQPEPLGLCDAIFRALPVIDPQQPVLVGLPDTIWFPENALRSLPDERMSFLLFPVSRPERFDAVVADEEGRVLEIQVKQADARSKWVWGAFKMPASDFVSLHKLWKQRGDEYIGTLINAWLERGGSAWAVRAGESYIDVGATDGYFEAVRLLGDQPAVHGGVRSE